MLVLTRRLGESFMVGDDIEVIIKDIGRGHVRIGIVAPKKVVVHRREVWEEVKARERSEGYHENR